MEHKFKINLGGMIDLLSNHLYNSPNVYIRELLQNGVDAITARKEYEPDHEGLISIHVGMDEESLPGKGRRAKIVFQDNGIGLSEEETHKFLSTIGESSKKSDELESKRSDYIGQFGIGLLSCFVVSDEIVVITKSAKTADADVVEWRGRHDGTYSIRVRKDETVSAGTTVYLLSKEHFEEWFEEERVIELTQHFGALLPFPVVVGSGDDEKVINITPPWKTKYESRTEEWDAYMAFGKDMFGQEFFSCIPLRSDIGEVEGIAYILSYSPNPTATRKHRVYLKNMLLSETSENLLPKWAFFVTCVINTKTLRPTASRDSFYEDDTLADTRDALGKALIDYLVKLKEKDPARLETLINLHYRAIKALCVYDDNFCRIFADWLPFESSMGRMSLGDFREENEVIRYVPSVDAFRQIAQVAASQSIGIINAGYSYDVDIIEKLPRIFGVKIERVDSTDLSDSFEKLSAEESVQAERFLAIANLALSEFQCKADIQKFEPADLPALFLAGEDVKFMRSLQKSREVSDDHWSSILDNIAGSSKSDGVAQLCFNYKNPLARKLAGMNNKEVLKLAVHMLYVQSLLMGHHPLSSKEMTLLNTGLIDLIELAIGDDSENWLN